MNLMKEYLKRETGFFKILNNILPNPDKIKEKNGGSYDIYRDIMIDSHLSAVIEQRKMQVLQMGWEVACMNEEKRKEALTIIQNMNLQNIGNQILNSILFGFNVSEIIWKREKNKIIPVDIISKPQEWFSFDKNNKLKIIPYVGNNIKTTKDVPKYKFILTQHKPTFDNPYGEALLKKCYWPVKIKQTTMNSWNDLVDKFGIPYLIGVMSETATDAERDNFLDELQQMIIDNVLVRKPSQNVEIKTDMKYDTGGMFQAVSEYQDKEISKAILTVTLTVDVGNVGSYSVANVHKELLGYLAIGDKKLIEAAINKMFDYYNELNYGKNTEPIKLKLVKKENITEEYAKRDKILSEIGIEFTKDYFKKTYNLREEDFELGRVNQNVAVIPNKTEITKKAQ